MAAKFFVLYGDATITPHITNDAELLQWVRRDGVPFDPETYENQAQWLAKADRMLMGRYKVWGLFEYTPEGLAEFLEAAGMAGDLVGIHAMELAEEYIQEVQRALAVALTEAQQKVMDRVQFPLAGDKAAFGKYQEKIAYIRDLSIKSLYEYVENGDETPE